MKRWGSTSNCPVCATVTNDEKLSTKDTDLWTVNPSFAYISFADLSQTTRRPQAAASLVWQEEICRRINVASFKFKLSIFTVKMRNTPRENHGRPCARDAVIWCYEVFVLDGVEMNAGNKVPRRHSHPFRHQTNTLGSKPSQNWPTNRYPL